MNIAIDANIIRSDFLFRSTEYHGLFDYLNKTKSQIVLPKVVLLEIEELHRQELEKRVSEINRNVKNLNLALPSAKAKIPAITIDINNENEAYIDFVKSFLKIQDSDILPIDNSLLPEVLDRATKKVKPFSEKDRGFRDTLIWLTIKEFVIRNNAKQISFITNNVNDFCDPKNPADLAPNLKQECENQGVEIFIYASVKDFINNHSNKIEFITNDWLHNLLATVELREFVEEYFESKSTKPKFLIDFERESGGWKEALGEFEIVKADVVDIDNFWVYEMGSGELIVNIDLDLNIQVIFNYGEYYQHGDGSLDGAVDVHRDTYTNKTTLSIRLNVNRQVQGIEVLEIK